MSFLGIKGWSWYLFIFLVIKWSANFVATETRKQHLNCSFHTYFLSFVLCNCVIYFAIFCKSIIVIVSLLITTRESLHTIITIPKIGYMNRQYCFLGDSINIYKYCNVRNEILQKGNFTFTYIRFLNYIEKKEDAKTWNIC